MGTSGSEQPSSAGPERRLEVLDWDSEFFGIPIGRVDLEGASADDLAAVDEQARGLGLRCLYGFLDGAVADQAWAVQGLGWRLVEVGVTLSRRPGPADGGDATVRVGTPDDVPALVPTLDRLAPWSRFAIDPGFGPDAARRLHHAWVQRAARQEGGTRLYIAEEGGELAAFMTFVEDPVPRIDLIAALNPGSGAGAALVVQAMEDTIRAGRTGEIQGGPIAARNVVALRFAEKLGFFAATTRYVFHRWLDDAGRGDR